MMASTISGNVGNAGRGAVEEVVTALPVGKLVQADEVAMCLA